jgi:hypothetical protein
LWAADLGGQVAAVAGLGDLDGNGSPDWIAASEMGFAAAFSGGTGSAGLAPGKAARRAPGPIALRGGRMLFAFPGGPRDGRGRAAGGR